MVRSLFITFITALMLIISLNAGAASGVLEIHNEWGDEVDYELSNTIASKGTLDVGDKATIYINKTEDLDKMKFTYLVDGESFSRTLNHTCGYARGKKGSLKIWLSKTNKAAIYITFPGRGDHPIFLCKAS